MVISHFICVCVLLGPCIVVILLFVYCVLFSNCMKIIFDHCMGVLFSPVIVVLVDSYMYIKHFWCVWGWGFHMP